MLRISPPPPTDLGVVPHDLIGAALGVDPPHRREREARGPETRSPAHRPVSESPTVRSDTQVYLQTETLPTYLTYIKFHHPFQTSLPGLSRQGPFQPIPPQNWARQTAASAQMGTLSGSRVPLPFSSSPSGHHLLPLPSVRPSLSCRVTLTAHPNPLTSVHIPGIIQQLFATQTQRPRNQWPSDPPMTLPSVHLYPFVQNSLCGFQVVASSTTLGPTPRPEPTRGQLRPGANCLRPPAILNPP